MRILLGITLGALAMGLTQGIIGYFILLTAPDKGSNWLSIGKDAEIILGTIFEIVVGAIVGGILGGLMMLLKVTYPKSLIFSFIFTLLASVAFFFWTEGDLRHIGRYTILSFLVLGTICGTLISLLNQNSYQ